jgi:glycosyltransferase involved in cell wall biosynthesis
MPRSLFLVEVYAASPKIWGGVEVTVRSLVEGLARDGVVVLAPHPVMLPLPRYREERQRRRREEAEGRRLPPPPGALVLRPPYLHLPLVWGLTGPLQLFALGLWAALFRAGRVDLVHGHRAHPMGAVAVVLGAVLRRPAVVSVYGSEVHTDAVRGPWLVRFWIRRALRRAARVVGVSRVLLERAVALGAAAERVRFVPSGVDSARFFPQDAAALRPALGWPPGRRVLLCTSQFLPVKGHAVLLEAFRRLCARREDVLLVLTGEGPERPGVEAAVHEHGLTDRVLFPGLLDYEEVPRYMAAADALVLPSHNEGMPLCVIEAFACGRPAVATAVGGTPELVTDPRYGLLVPPGDATALADALGEALDRKWDAAALRSRAEEFAWPRIVEQLREVYREVAGGLGSA